MLKSLSALLCLAGVLAVPTTYIDPQHANTSTVLGARAASAPGNLWGVGFGPDPADIYQPIAKALNPALLSELAALVAINPDWIRKLVTYTGDPATITEVTVNLHRKDSLEPLPVLVKKFMVEHMGEPRSDAAEGWWVGAVEHARMYGIGYASTYDPLNSLDIVTGRRTKMYYTQINRRGWGPGDELIDKDRSWAIIKNAPREPLILQTKPVWDCANKVLPCGYSWRVVGGHGATRPGEPRWVTLYSRAGVRSTWDLNTIFPEIESIYGFANGAAEKP